LGSIEDTDLKYLLNKYEEPDRVWRVKECLEISHKIEMEIEKKSKE